MNIFQACDIRGVFPEDLNEETAKRMGYAVGVKLTGKSVVIGGDVRLSTPALKCALVEALLESGCNVTDIGTVATPVFYFAKKYFNADGGVMITASHNPSKYNGFKLAFGNMPTTDKLISEIQDLYLSGKRVNGKGTLNRKNIINEYMIGVASHFQKVEDSKKIRIVIDAGNGATSEIAPALYRMIGYDVVELFCEPDGRFPNRPPNPAIAENLTKLAECVKKNGASIGIAFDGDGDRMGVVDENGNAVKNDDCLVLLARDYLEKCKGTIVYDSKCSMVVREEIERLGGQPVISKSGHAFVKEAFLRHKAVFAGELSGHFFFHEIGYDDGMFSGLKLCKIASGRKSLSSLVMSIPKYLLTPDIRVPCEWDEKDKIVSKAAEKLSNYDISRIDGARADFIDGWGMIRASITEPILTLRFEAKTQESLNKIINIFLNIVPEGIKEKIIINLNKSNF